MRDDAWLLAAALLAGILAAWALYLAAPRQRLRTRPLATVPAALAALLLMVASGRLLGGAFGPAPAFFLMLANWMLALVSAPWLAGLLAGRRDAHGH